MSGISTFMGMLVSMIAILGGISLLGGNLANFFNVPSILLTIVPTLGSLVATCSMSAITKIPLHMKAVLHKTQKAERYIEDIVKIAELARGEGLLSLEGKLEEGDPFLNYGVGLAIDGSDEIFIQDAMRGHIEAMELRHSEEISIYEKGAAYAPAFGMCATVISLINMLMNLDFTDSTAINSLGTNMSAALLTTFYGCMLANIFFLPMAGRLKKLHKREMFCKALIYDGVICLVQEVNPAVLREMLLERVSPAIKKSMSKETGAGYGYGSK